MRMWMSSGGGEAPTVTTRILDLGLGRAIITESGNKPNHAPTYAQSKLPVTVRIFPTRAQNAIHGSS